MWANRSEENRLTDEENVIITEHGQGIQDFQAQTKIPFPKSAFKVEGNCGDLRLTLPEAVLSLSLGAAANSTITHF